ncbi:hypothetical protein WJX84_003580 [Apatococcus fuscideae]|uniref:ABC1 atypical kinase-like domain-containing protein n=1 Tax=Apatococcus fuscideae TaxID=2026836 RepID=A0AAW1T965_9CHLO
MPLAHEAWLTLRQSLTLLAEEQLLSAKTFSSSIQPSHTPLHYQTRAEAFLDRAMQPWRQQHWQLQQPHFKQALPHNPFQGFKQHLTSAESQQHFQRFQSTIGVHGCQTWAGFGAAELKRNTQWWRSLHEVYRNPHVPDWVRHRLPEFDWPSMRAWRLRELGIRPEAQHLRVAVINTLASGYGHIQRMLPIVVAQALQPNKYALAHSCPSERGMPGPLGEVIVPAGFLGGCWQVWGFLADTARLAALLFIFLPAILTSPMAYHWFSWRAAWMKRFRQAVERAGPAFIKWGQWAATRRDLFPPDFCAELQHLHTQAPSHPVADTFAALDRALQLPVTDLFDEFDGQPVASGSIGQVHRAVLGEQGASATGMPAGTVVAVKVRHPGVGFQIERDFRLMMRLAGLTSWLPGLRDLRLEESLRQFSTPLREQVDLGQEARNLWQFNFNFRGSSNVRFPFPLYPLVDQEVLVETFEHGKLISHYIDDQAGKHRKRLAKIGGQAVLQMMLKDNLIHSDLHPGNIMVVMEPPAQPLLAASYKLLSFLGKQNSPAAIDLLRPRLVLLDVGMATALSKMDQTNMMHLFRAFSEKDAPAMADATLAFSGASQSCPDPLAFRTHVQDFFAPIAAAKSDSWEGTGHAGGAEAMSGVLDMVRSHKVSLPGHICAVVVTTLVLEGWSSQLDPHHSVFAEVEAIFDPLKALKTRLNLTLAEQLPNAFGDVPSADFAIC